MCLLHFGFWNLHADNKKHRYLSLVASMCANWLILLSKPKTEIWFPASEFTYSESFCFRFWKQLLRIERGYYCSFKVIFARFTLSCQGDTLYSKLKTVYSPANFQLSQMCPIQVTLLRARNNNFSLFFPYGIINISSITLLNYI